MERKLIDRKDDPKLHNIVITPQSSLGLLLLLPPLPLLLGAATACRAAASASAASTTATPAATAATARVAAASARVAAAPGAAVTASARWSCCETTRCKTTRGKTQESPRERKMVLQRGGAHAGSRVMSPLQRCCSCHISPLHGVIELLPCKHFSFFSCFHAAVLT